MKPTRAPASLGTSGLSTRQGSDDMEEIFVTLPDGTRARARLQPGGWIEVPASREDVPVGEEITFEGRPHEIERVREGRSRVRKRLRVDPPIDLEDENRRDGHGRLR